MNKDFSKIYKILHNHSLSAGFTLVELLLAASITIVVVGIAGFGVVAITENNKKAKAETERRVELNRALEFITEEIRQAKTIAPNASDLSGAANFTQILSSGSSSITRTPVLKLEIPNISQRVIYYIASKETDSWRGPNLVYRWGPTFTASGGYSDPSTPASWRYEPLADLIVNTAPPSVSCQSGWSLNPSSSATGFYACVAANGKGAKIHLRGKLTDAYGNLRPPLEVSTKVFARVFETAAAAARAAARDAAARAAEREREREREAAEQADAERTATDRGTDAQTAADLAATAQTPAAHTAAAQAATAHANAERTAAAEATAARDAAAQAATAHTAAAQAATAEAAAEQAAGHTAAAQAATARAVTAQAAADGAVTAQAAAAQAATARAVTAQAAAAAQTAADLANAQRITTDGGTVTFTQASNLFVEVLGGSITCGSPGPEIPTTTTLNITNMSPKTLPSSTKSLSISVPIGSRLTVTGAARGNNSSGSCRDFSSSYNSATNTITGSNTTSPPQQVWTLRNGQTPPAFRPYGAQRAIDAFLTKYLDPLTGKVSIRANQVIFLYELGTTSRNSDAYDLQDLVVLATVSAN